MKSERGDGRLGSAAGEGQGKPRRARKGWSVMGSETMSPEPPTDGVSKGLSPQLPWQLRGRCEPCWASACLLLPLRGPCQTGTSGV